MFSKPPQLLNKSDKYLERRLQARYMYLAWSRRSRYLSYTYISKKVVLQRYINIINIYLKHWARKVRWEFLFKFWRALLECKPHTVKTYGGEQFGTVILHNKDVKTFWVLILVFILFKCQESFAIYMSSIHSNVK